MTTEQILREFEALPREEQTALARAIEARLQGNGAHDQSATVQKVSPETAEARRARRRAAAKRLEGALKWPGTPPTDEELQQMRADYLQEKYG